MSSCLPNNPDITPVPRMRTRHRSQAAHLRSQSIPSRAHSQMRPPPQPRDSGFLQVELWHLLYSYLKQTLVYNGTPRPPKCGAHPYRACSEANEARVKCSEGQQRPSRGHTQPCLARIPKTLLCEEVGLVRPSLCTESSEVCGSQDQRKAFGMPWVDNSQPY